VTLDYLLFNTLPRRTKAST